MTSLFLLAAIDDFQKLALPVGSSTRPTSCTAPVVSSRSHCATRRVGPSAGNTACTVQTEPLRKTQVGSTTPPEPAPNTKLVGVPPAWGSLKSALRTLVGSGEGTVATSVSVAAPTGPLKRKRSTASAFADEGRQAKRSSAVPS